MTALRSVANGKLARQRVLSVALSLLGLFGTAILVPVSIGVAEAVVTQER